MAWRRRLRSTPEALGIPAPLERPSKPEHETAEELQIWLKTHDPLTDSRNERLISQIIFAPPPAQKGTVLKTVYRPLDEREQAEFLEFVDRLKRELRRRGAIGVPPPEQTLADPVKLTGHVVEQQPRRGRLSKNESEAKRASMLATIRQHPSLKEDPGTLAGMVGVSEMTVRRWLDDEEQKYRQSAAANPARQEE